MKSINLDCGIASMPRLIHIYLTRHKNNTKFSGDLLESWDAPVDLVVNSRDRVQLTCCFEWSDYSHVSHTDYLINDILHRYVGFPKSLIQRLFKLTLRDTRDRYAAHAEFGSLQFGLSIKQSDASRDLMEGSASIRRSLVVPQ